MPKVSVLMPVYNAERFLAQAIDSILAQDFTDWELILINDGSTDASENIIAQYEDDRIYYIKNSKNLGLIKTLNTGIELCAGKYIARMDADDISHPARFRRQTAFMDKHPDYLMCGTDAYVIDNENRRTGKIKNLATNNLLQINLLFSPPFIHPSVMIRRDVLAENKYDENYKHVEDFELWCRIAKLGKVANLNRELLEYRWHDSNVSVLNSEVQDKLKDQIIKEQLLDLGLSPNEEELNCHKITFNLFHLGKEQPVSVGKFDAISDWFSTLLKHNRIEKKYSQTDFMAFLWARWIVLCISQKKYSLMFFPAFSSFRLRTLFVLLKLVLFLKSKK